MYLKKRRHLVFSLQILYNISMQSDQIVLRPQPGPQTAFCISSADVTIFGGAAGPGKTWSLLFSPLRYIGYAGFSAVLFRRTVPEITIAGGLWDAALDMYGGLCIRTPEYTIHFTKAAKMDFRSMQHEKDKYKFQGAEIPFILFDEATHFTSTQFFYLLGRNRISSKLRRCLNTKIYKNNKYILPYFKPQVKATCNPDPDSFLCSMLEGGGYINTETGYPIPESSGVVRYFQRIDEQIFWAENKEDLIEKYKDKASPKSFTFIPARLEDNSYIDPDYKSNLFQLTDYEVKRLYGGCWYARPDKGELFRRRFFLIESKPPEHFERVVRCWDRASTIKSEKNKDPDYTVGLLLGCDFAGKYWILDIERDRWSPAGVQAKVIEVANDDVRRYGDVVTILIGQDPAQAGQVEIDHFVKVLCDFNLVTFLINKSKLSVWKPAARHAKNHNFNVLYSNWTEALLKEAESVTDGTQKGHDDIIDSLAQAYLYLDRYASNTSGHFNLGSRM